ncbi:MAG TPA: iduronate-2-sulfatase [Prolixibacteraceae bacterium]|nr:iduronate-2-sulfatase [Prolixibacteraceae bacterium]
MKNSILLMAAVAGSLVAQEASAAKNSKQKTDKNVLFIVVDDLTTTLGCYGHPTVKTPNIDRLAKMGVQYNHAYCNYAVCGPSRSSFLTGLKPETTTILDNRKTLQSVLGDRVTLPYLFRQNGFYTMSLGKVFHGDKEHNDLKAWDEIYGYGPTPIGKTGENRNMTGGALKWCEWMAAEGDDEDQPDGQIARKAVEFISAPKDKPFFLAVGFHKPHDPFFAPKKYFDMYPLEVCNPPVLPEGWKPPYKHTLPNETAVFNKFTDQDKREFLRSYYACSSFLDAQVGKLLKALEETNQLENTLIVFFGDHGYHLGEHNWWNKVTIFEKGTRAPFIMAGQSVGKKGVVSDAMFEYIDIYPTLAELLKLKNTPEYLEGKSFAEVVNDPSKPFRSSVQAVVSRGEMLGRMVKNEKWRYIEWDKGQKGSELYDQVNDPVEYNNLANLAEYAKVIQDMKKLMYQ